MEIRDTNDEKKDYLDLLSMGYSRLEIADAKFNPRDIASLIHKYIGGEIGIHFRALVATDGQQSWTLAAVEMKMKKFIKWKKEKQAAK